MYLWQKHKYKTTLLTDDRHFIALGNVFNKIKPEIVAWDTETTGLHITNDKPFLMGIGFADRLYVYEPSEWRNNYVLKLVGSPFVKYFVAHNAKFDYHMFRNFGTKIPRNVNLACSYSLARLTDYVDTSTGLGLARLTENLFDKDAKFGEIAVKAQINRINRDRYRIIKSFVEENRKEIGYNYTQFKDMYFKRVQHTEHELDQWFNELDKVYSKATYEDVYKEKPNLMINYLFDDLLMTLEVVNKLLPILDAVDKGRKTWHRENKLISVVGDMEATGMKIDVKYLLDSRKNLSDYIDTRYEKLWELAGIKDIEFNTDNVLINRFKLLKDNPNFSVGQHAVIKLLFERKFKIGMVSSDVSALEEIIAMEDYPKEAREIAELIIELRTLSKWLSTNIEGILNKLIGDRLYTDINNSGTVTGRVSGDMQQQPSGKLTDINGNELFYPRKAFINDEGYTLYYMDFSNMELRVQAHYTLLTSEGDLNMCRAFIPFKNYNFLSGKEYNVIANFDEWNSGEWVDVEGHSWKKVDLHSATTFKAFPNITPEDEDFSHYRDLGKRANFLKNYGGGLTALQSSLKVSLEVAQALDKGYYEAFPKILDYQKWVEDNIRKYGYVENLMGRRYYFNNTNTVYTGYNYLIQGSCADYLKDRQIKLDELLVDYDSHMVMPIHDEMVFRIKNGEEHLIPKLKEIMEDSKGFINTIPMIVDVNYTDTNWAEKKDYVEEVL